MPHNLTSHDPISQSVERRGAGGKSEPTAQERCEAKNVAGQKKKYEWDEVQKVCVRIESRLPSPQKITETTDKLIEGVAQRLPSPFSRVKPTPDTRKEACELQGGVWENGVCVPKPQEEERKLIGGIDRGTGSALDLQIQQQAAGDQDLERGTIVTGEDGKIAGFINSEGQFVKDRQTAIAIMKRQEGEEALLEGTQTAEQQSQAATIRASAAALFGQVGQLDPSTGIIETPLDFAEALTQGIVGSIPRALSYAVTGAGIGFTGGAVATSPAGGIGAIPAAAIGAAAGFVSGISSGMISSMKSQRTDNTNAQQRVLDEGKQTLTDWSTMAKTDPANAEFYVSQFNLQLQLIQNAYTQMKIDTQGDLGKFENAIPNLAEFESFYSVGGERDALVIEMGNSILTFVDPIYSMQELVRRRG
jgi:hypothetical protein